MKLTLLLMASCTIDHQDLKHNSILPLDLALDFGTLYPNQLRTVQNFHSKKRYEILFSLCSNKKRAILNSKELHRFLQNIALHAEFWFDCA